MRIYIGGVGHGQETVCADETGSFPFSCAYDPNTAFRVPAIGDFHLLVRDLLKKGRDVQAFTRELLRKNPDAAVVCNEVGEGVVPLDPFERRWREETGRALGILAAAPGARVVRVWYGIPEVLKDPVLAPARGQALFPGPSDACLQLEYRTPLGQAGGRYVYHYYHGRLPDDPPELFGVSFHSVPAPREILLIRHGRTRGNDERRYVGVTDEPLSPAGRNALKTLCYPQTDFVYVSPLRRARETAEILFPGAKQLVVPGLREMDFGDFEGRSADEMENDPAYRAWVDGGCLGETPNGESRHAHTWRTSDAFFALLKNDKSPRLTIVAHGGTFMALGSLYGRPRREYYEWQPKNGGGFLFKLRQDEGFPTELDVSVEYEGV